MDAALIVTVVSLVTALTMSIVTWRIIHDDRRRSAARVMALASELAQGPGPAEAASGLTRSSRPVTPARSREADEPSAHAQSLREPAAHISFRPASMPTVDPETPGTGRPTADLFSSAARPSNRLSPPVATLLAALAIAAVLVIGLFVLRDTGGANVVTAMAVSPAPLELVALRHSQDKSVLTVSGLVQNPPEGSLARRITAVVFLFDRQGTFLASGRAPLDVQALTPGDVAPFVVNTSVEVPVGRYRISFRREDGGVLPHVDRRGRK